MPDSGRVASEKSNKEINKRRRDAEASRETILDAAEKLFAEKGYEGTNLAEIGAAAGLSRGTPAYFFGSKAGLYAAVKERLAGYVHEFAEQARSTGASTGDGPAYEAREAHEAHGVHEVPHAAIAAAVRAYIDFLAARPTYIRFIEREAAGEDDFLKHSEHSGEVSGEAANLAGSLAEFGNRFLERELLKDPRGEHQVPDEEISRLSASMCAVCCFPFLQGGGLFTTFGLDPYKTGFTEEHKEHAVRFILGGLYGQPYS